VKRVINITHNEEILSKCIVTLAKPNEPSEKIKETKIKAISRMRYLLLMKTANNENNTAQILNSNIT
jgi:hypothetical protein